MEKEKTQDSLGKAVTEHAAGMLIIGSAMAGIGAIAGMRRGGSIKAEATLAGVMGILGGLGFGRTVYTGLFGQNRRASGPNAVPETWVEKVQGGGAPGTDHQRGRT